MKSSIAFRTLLACFLALAPVSLALSASDPELKPDRPDTYTVQKGDTLWGIASRFLREPWRWPEIWRMNREQIRNPHRIYPGNVIVLENIDGRPQLRLADQRDTVRLGPQVRESSLADRPVPSIPAEDLEPWLTRSLVVTDDFFAGAPKIVSARDQKLLLVQGDAVYAFGIDPAKGQSWNIYRRGDPVYALRSKEVLGHNAIYLGTARIDRQGDVSRLIVGNADREILVGDFLVPTPPGQLASYVPRAPEREISGSVAALPEGVGGVGKPGFVTLDVGRESGLEVGDVLAVYRSGGRLRDPRDYKDPDILTRETEQTLLEPKPERWVSLPDDRIGLVFIFRVFERTAFGFVVESDLPIEIGDLVRNPGSR